MFKEKPGSHVYVFITAINEGACVSKCINSTQ